MALEVSDVSPEDQKALADIESQLGDLGEDIELDLGRYNIPLRKLRSYFLGKPVIISPIKRKGTRVVKVKIRKKPQTIIQDTKQ